MYNDLRLTHHRGFTFGLAQYNVQRKIAPVQATSSDGDQNEIKYAATYVSVTI